MAKTKEELQQLKTEYESLVEKLQDLNEDELNQVAGGDNDTIYIRGLETITPYASNEHQDWKSNNDVPAETGNYKIG